MEYELVVAGEDGVTRFWELGEWTFRRAIKAQKKKAIIALPTNGIYFFTDSRDKSVIVWDMADWSPIYRLRGFCAPIALLRCNSHLLAYVAGIFGTTGLEDLSILHRISPI